MSEKSITKEMLTKESIHPLFNEETEVINSLLSIEEKLKSEYLINHQDKKLFNFLLIYFRKSQKLLDIKTILRHKKISKIFIYKINLEEYNKKINLILSKFFQICIFNFSRLGPILGYQKENFTKKIFHLIKIYYLHNLLDAECLVNIIRLKLYSCFNEDKYNLIISEKKNFMFNNKIIVNISPLEEIINFLISFTEEEMSE